MLQRIINRLTSEFYIKSDVKSLILRLIFTNPALKVLNHNVRHTYKIIFYGTDELSKVTLNMLNTNRLSSPPDRVVASLQVVCIKLDCPVRRYASSNNLIIHTWPYEVPKDEYDVGVVVSFGHMIPTASILACKYGIINAHPSLLPRWRGAAPIFHTLLNGDIETGVTITQVSPNKFDVGKILLQETYRIPNGFTSKNLTKELSQLAADMVLKTLKNLPEYLESSYPQPAEGVTYARKIKPQHCQIDWNQETSIKVLRKLKALAETCESCNPLVGRKPFYDGSQKVIFYDENLLKCTTRIIGNCWLKEFHIYTFWKDVKVVILKYVELEEVESANLSSLISCPVSPGYCYFHKKRKTLFVKCKDGWCGITSVKIPKKGNITALDFYNGFMTKVNIKECYFELDKNKLL